MAGGVISRKMIIAIGTGVIKANCSSKLKGFGLKAGQEVYRNEWSGLREKAQPVRSSQASNSYSKKNFYSTDALPRLLKKMTYRRNLF